MATKKKRKPDYGLETQAPKFKPQTSFGRVKQLDDIKRPTPIEFKPKTTGEYAQSLKNDLAKIEGIIGQKQRMSQELKDQKARARSRLDLIQKQGLDGAAARRFTDSYNRQGQRAADSANKRTNDAYERAQKKHAGYVERTGKRADKTSEKHAKQVEKYYKDRDKRGDKRRAQREAAHKRAVRRDTKKFIDDPNYGLDKVANTLYKGDPEKIQAYKELIQGRQARARSKEALKGSYSKRLFEAGDISMHQRKGLVNDWSGSMAYRTKDWYDLAFKLDPDTIDKMDRQRTRKYEASIGREGKRAYRAYQNIQRELPLINERTKKQAYEDTMRHGSISDVLQLKFGVKGELGGVPLNKGDLAQYRKEYKTGKRQRDAILKQREQRKALRSLGVDVEDWALGTTSFQSEFGNVKALKELNQTISHYYTKGQYDKGDRIANTVIKRLEKIGVPGEIIPGSRLDYARLGIDPNLVNAIKASNEAGTSNITPREMRDILMDEFRTRKSKDKIRYDQIQRNLKAGKKANVWDNMEDPSGKLVNDYFNPEDMTNEILTREQDVEGMRSQLVMAVSNKIYGHISQSQLIRGRLIEEIGGLSDAEIKLLYAEFVSGRFARYTEDFSSSGDKVNNRAQYDDLNTISRIKGAPADGDESYTPPESSDGKSLDAIQSVFKSIKGTPRLVRSASGDPITKGLRFVNKEQAKKTGVSFSGDDQAMYGNFAAQIGKNLAKGAINKGVDRIQKFARSEDSYDQYKRKKHDVTTPLKSAKRAMLKSGGMSINEAMAKLKAGEKINNGAPLPTPQSYPNGKAKAETIRKNREAGLKHKADSMGLLVTPHDVLGRTKRKPTPAKPDSIHKGRPPYA